MAVFPGAIPGAERLTNRHRDREHEAAPTVPNAPSKSANDEGSGAGAARAITHGSVPPIAGLLVTQIGLPNLPM